MANLRWNTRCCRACCGGPGEPIFRFISVIISKFCEGNSRCFAAHCLADCSVAAMAPQPSLLLQLALQYQYAHIWSKLIAYTMATTKAPNRFRFRLLGRLQHTVAITICTNTNTNNFHLQPFELFCCYLWRCCWTLIHGYFSLHFCCLLVKFSVSLSICYFVVCPFSGLMFAATVAAQSKIVACRVRPSNFQVVCTKFSFW